MELPPGFRFHPTDEELVTHYLSKKVINDNFSALAMADVDLNKVEPWDLPWKAKMGEKQWYFFCLRDKKYPTGLRTNRATAAGYWKATGKDKEIYRGNSLVGMKKTLVFYTGRAPKGEKTNWVMHEYRMEGKFSLQNRSEWVICRVFEKSAPEKKIQISGVTVLNQIENELVHVPCFSIPIETQKNQQEMISYLNNSIPNSQFPIQDQVFFKGLMGNHVSNLKTEDGVISVISQETGSNSEMNMDISSVVSKVDFGSNLFDDYKAPSASAGASEFDCVWNY